MSVDQRSPDVSKDNNLRSILPNGISSPIADGSTGYNYFVPDHVYDPGYAANKQALVRLDDAARTLPQRAMQAAQANGASSAGVSVDPAFRNQQLALAQSLYNQAQGNGPSVAGSQLQQSTEQNLQAALAQAASARGGNLGAMQYQLGNARANIQQQAAMGLAQARIQEQMGAYQQLGGVLDSGRGMDLNTAQLAQQNNQFNAQQTQQNNQFNAGQIQGANSANLTAGVAQDQFKQNMRFQLMQQGYSEDQANYLSNLQQSQFTAQQLNAAEAANHGVALQQSAQGIQLGGAAIGAMGALAASAAMASDERLKTDIADGDKNTQAFLDDLAAKHYSYKDEKYGVGPRIGIMAQDAEKSDVGRSFVFDTPEGKMLDMNKAVSAALASVAYLNKRMKKLER